MKNLNNATIEGRLTRDPETKQTPNGKSIVNFAIASNGYWGGEEKVSFFDCKAFGKTGEYITQYLRKGSLVILTYRLTQERWEREGQKRSRVVLSVNEVYGRKDGDSWQKQQTQGNGPVTDDDDIPF